MSTMVALLQSIANIWSFKSSHHPMRILALQEILESIVKNVGRTIYTL
jgi:hypothetical protein